MMTNSLSAVRAFTSIDPLRRAATLAADVSLDLQRQGLPLEYVDLGGGLGVSYDGSDVCRTASTSAPT